MKHILNAMIEGQSATPDQVHQVIDLLMNGKLDPAFGGAFLALQMANGIDGGQLAAGLKAMMGHAVTLELDASDAIDNCGTGGDGGRSFNVSTTAAFVIAGAGHVVAKHGNRAVSSKCGSADLLEALGINLSLAPYQIKDCINEVGIGFMFAPTFHGAMRHAAVIRKGMGIRTMFNMLGPLANPAQVKHQLIGVFREDLTDVFAEALATMGRTAYVVYGEDGADEVSLTTRTKVTEVRNGQISSSIFDPRRHGFDLVESDALEGGDLETNKDIFHRVLRDKQDGAAMEMVVLNAGFAMHTSGRYEDLDQAFDAAAKAIKSGAAWDKVQALVAWTQQG